MSSPLLSCPACDGLVPAARASCPHCDHALAPRPRARLARMLARLALGASAVTLMACYGVAPRYGDPAYAGDHCVDQDADGVCAPQDCNDADRSIVPGGEDPDLDGIDQNCDGVDGWRDPNEVAVPPPDGAATEPPPEPAPIATDPAPAPPTP